jgi:hypothetical protein
LSGCLWFTFASCAQRLQRFRQSFMVERPGLMCSSRPGAVSTYLLKRLSCLEGQHLQLEALLRPSQVIAHSQLDEERSDSMEHPLPVRQRHTYWGLPQGQKVREINVREVLHIERKRAKRKPNMGLEPMTCRLNTSVIRVGCSTNGAHRAKRCLML